MNALLEVGLSNAAMALVLAVLAAGIGRVCRRPALSYTLWLLVMLKLITPPIVGIPIPWLAAALTTPADFEKPLGPADAQGLEPALGAALSAELDGSGFAPMDSSSENVLIRVAVPGVPAASSRYAEMLSAVTSAIVSRPESWAGWIVSLWLAGSVVWFARAGVRIRSFQRILEHAQPAPRDLQVRVAELADHLGLADRPGVWVVPISVSPLVWVLGGHAKLVLPASLLERLGPDERDALLAHELAHLRRHDHWIRWLELAVLGLYWWNPVAWWARRELGRAEEQCCDAWVVWSLPGVALTYARALLKTVDFLAEARPAFPPAASGAGHVHTLRRRVNMILHKPLYHRLSWPARCAAILLGLAVLPVAPQRLAAQNTNKPSNPAPVDDRIAARSAEDSPRADDDRVAPDLERRLRRLEEKMDKIALELKSTRAAHKQAESPVNVRIRKRNEAAALLEDAKRLEPPKQKHDLEKKIVDKESAAQLRRGIEEMVKKSINSESLEQLKREIKESVEKGVNPEELEKLGREIEASVRKSINPEELEKLGREIEKSVRKSINTEELEKLGREIEESVKKSINPQQMEKLGHEIAESIKKSINPEKMEQLGRDIEVIVKKSVDPERIEKLARQYEEALKKSTDPDRSEKVRQKLEESIKESKSAASRKERQAERELAKPRPQEPGSSEDSKDAPANVRRRPDRESSDLDRRLRALEDQLDRLTRELEKRGESDKKGAP